MSHTLHVLTFCAFLLPAAVAGGQAQPAPPVSPSWIKVPTPAPSPVPPPAPGTIPRLTGEELFVLDSSEPCFVLVSPPGLVSVTQDVGPLRIRGKFVGGNGKYETKTFTGKAVITVEAIGTGRVELIVVKEGAKSAADVFRQQVDANVAPIPPPLPPDPPKPPTPPDPPKPPVDPAPIPAPGLRVLITYESKDLHNLTAGHRAIMYGAKTRAHMGSVCVKEPDGTAGWRMFDKDTVMTGESALWRDAMARKRGGLPWLLISNPGKGGFEGTLPSTPEAFLELLKRFE